MAEVNLPSWSEISQAFEGLQLNSKAATWENILARLARIESRLLERERRAAATLPPLQREPDPPDGPSLYTTAQPPYLRFQSTGYINNNTEFDRKLEKIEERRHAYRQSRHTWQQDPPYQPRTMTSGPPYQSPRSRTYWDPQGLSTPQGYMAYDQPLPPGCPPPHTADSREALEPPHNVHAGFDPWQPEDRPSRWIYSGMDSHAMRRNPHTEYHQGKHEYKPSRSIPPPSLPSHCRSAMPPPAAATPSPPLRSDHMPKQPNPALPLELPPSATPGPYRPLQLLPVTAPLLASNPHPQAVVPSSVKKAEVTKVVEGSGGEFGSEKKMGRPKHSKNKKKIGVKNETEAMQLVPLSGGKIPSMNSRDGAVSGARQVVDTVDVFSSEAIKMVIGENGVSDVTKRGRRTITRCSFDPGGDPSPWLRLTTLCIASWFPP